VSVIDKIRIVTIEGWGDNTGIIKHCYPDVPSYASAGAQYYKSLAEPPTGVSSDWNIQDSKTSMGRLSLQFDRTFADELMRTYGRPVTYINEGAALASGFPTVTLRHNSTGSTITAPQVVYSERETWKVTAIVASLYTITRGYAGSADVEHPDRVGVYTSIPMWAGRKVTIYEVDADAAGAGSEELVRVGYIKAEPKQGIHWPTVEVVDQFHRARLGGEEETRFAMRFYDEGDDAAPIVEFQLRPGESIAPRFHDDGGYFYLPKGKVSVKGTYDSTDGWRFQAQPLVTGDFPKLTDGRSEFWLAYEMAYSSLEDFRGAGPFTPFGYDNGAFVPSANPMHIALNLLTSKDGTNTPGGGANNYDRGTRLAPDYALGVEHALVDIDDFELAAAELAGVVARRLWIGGPKAEMLSDIFHRMLAPWGYAIGLNRNGKWVVLRVADAYATESPTAINSTNISGTRIREVDHEMLGRALDSVIILADPWPDGSSEQAAVVSEMSGERFYPSGNGVKIGAEQEFKNAPYDSNDLVENTEMYGFVASRMRMLALRSFVVSVPVGPSLFGQVDIGDAVTILEVVFVNPSTGDRLNTGDDPISGLVIGIQEDYARRIDTLRIILTPDDRVASIAPSARVDSYAGGTDTATVEADTYSGDDDAGAFTVDDCVVLLDDRHVLASDDGQAFPTYVKAIGVNTLQFSQTPGGAAAPFRDNAGNPIAPIADDVITYAHYDAVNEYQQDTFAHGADGADPPQSPDLGAANDAAYVYGR
jgi:hypothetical protein